MGAGESSASSNSGTPICRNCSLCSGVLVVIALVADEEADRTAVDVVELPGDHLKTSLTDKSLNHTAASE